MRIGKIEIPDSEVERLSKAKRKILYALVEALPYALTTWNIYMVGGTGAPARIRELNQWLIEYDLIIKNERISSNLWKYWIQDKNMIPLSPKEVVGHVANW